ncbi:hypothetical protein [Micromonospora sp. NPDC047074]|uniref:hypothetical protein n=1 Tax=Micromonospora sp. NPDC047074 TaxID=3154339 RepID=UPI0033C72717
MTAPTPPPVPAQLAQLRTLIAAARANWVWLAGSAVLLAAIVHLESFDNEEIAKAIKNWDEAAKYLGGDQFGKAMESVPPSAEEWNFEDREAFDKFVQQLGQEVSALAAALTTNKDSLQGLMDHYNGVIDSLNQVLWTVLIAVIASVAIQYIPGGQAVAQAIGVAGLTIAMAVMALVFTEVGSALSTITSSFRGAEAHQFTTESKPGFATGPDPDIKDIKIDWVQDSGFYTA